MKPDKDIDLSHIELLFCISVSSISPLLTPCISIPFSGLFVSLSYQLKQVPHLMCLKIDLLTWTIILLMRYTKTCVDPSSKDISFFSPLSWRWKLCKVITKLIFKNGGTYCQVLLDKFKFLRTQQHGFLKINGQTSIVSFMERGNLKSLRESKSISWLITKIGVAFSIVSHLKKRNYLPLMNRIWIFSRKSLLLSLLGRIRLFLLFKTMSQASWVKSSLLLQPSISQNAIEIHL